MEVRIHVEDMTCHNCTKILRGALAPIPGVSGVAFKKQQKNILIQFDPETVSLNRIVEAIHMKGYHADVRHAKKALDAE
jgi:copper chaperone CopZ